ncbi:hypothetical protein F2Q70_00002356 [Brassica cretica]|uniref:Uncharacterized protein n=1 Tax=Brassica cretica TaxID=69181 RepID=A0A8S9IZX5_BRACR|nr:hypothetical protein F2Q70_00002356 [Brassica cretica]
MWTELSICGISKWTELWLSVWGIRELSICGILMWSELSGSVAALASACSFRVAFQALCGVNYKPGFGGFARSRGKYLDLPSIARLALHDSDGYKLRGVHWVLTTPETTYEFPRSEATRRTSPFCDSSSMVRTSTGFRRISKNELGECAGFSGRAKLVCNSLNLDILFKAGL